MNYKLNLTGSTHINILTIIDTHWQMTFYKRCVYSHSQLKYDRLSHCIHASSIIFFECNFKITYMLILTCSMIIMLICISSILSEAKHFLAILSLLYDFSVEVPRPGFFCSGGLGEGGSD